MVFEITRNDQPKEKIFFHLFIFCFVQFRPTKRKIYSTNESSESSDICKWLDVDGWTQGIFQCSSTVFLHFVWLLVSIIIASLVSAAAWCQTKQKKNLNELLIWINREKEKSTYRFHINIFFQNVISCVYRGKKWNCHDVED